MKTLKELSGAFIGEINAAVMFRVFLGIYSVVTGNRINWRIEDYVIIAGWLAFTMAITYVGWTLYKGIKADVLDIKETIDKRKEAKKA